MPRGKGGAFYDDDDFDDGYDDDYDDGFEEYDEPVTGPAHKVGVAAAAAAAAVAPPHQPAAAASSSSSCMLAKHSHALAACPHPTQGAHGHKAQAHKATQKQAAAQPAHKPHTPASAAGASPLAVCLCDPPPPRADGRPQRGGASRVAAAARISQARMASLQQPRGCSSLCRSCSRSMHV